MKSESFAEYQDIPGQVNVELEIALGSATAPRKELQSHGWHLVDPLAVTRDPWTYQSYLQQSSGEFSLAKHGYLVGRSGWFSERSACYLASGRPIVTQDTGFSQIVPCGRGLHAFHDLDSAIDAFKEIQGDYDVECTAARDLAAEYFDSRKVLRLLIDRAMEPMTVHALQSHGRPESRSQQSIP